MVEQTLRGVRRVRARAQQLHPIRAHRNHVIGKQVVNHIVSELVIRAIAVVHIALRLAALALGGLNIHPQLLPRIATYVIIAVHVPGGRHAL